MIKCKISAALIVVFCLSHLYSAFASSINRMDLMLSEGENPYVFKQGVILPENEIERIREELADEYRTSVVRPQGAEPIMKTSEEVSPLSAMSVMPLAEPLEQDLPETERFRIYPVTLRENGSYVFKGLFVAGNIEDEEALNFLSYEIQDIASSTSFGPYIINLLGDYIYPDSRVFGYDQYVARTANWQGDEFFREFKNDVLYHFDLIISGVATSTNASPTNAPIQSPAQEELEPDAATPASAPESAESDSDIQPPTSDSTIIEQEDNLITESTSPTEARLLFSIETDSSLDPAMPTTAPESSEPRMDAQQPSEPPISEEDIFALVESATPTTAIPKFSPFAADLYELYTQSESFIIYEVLIGDTLAKIAKYFQVPLSVIVKDNNITNKQLKRGSTLFIRNPKNTTLFMRKDTILGKDEAYFLGGSEATEFANSLVNLSTGNLFYPVDDVTVDEYGGFAIKRNYNSKANGITSLFGDGFSSNLDMSLVYLDDDTMLFITTYGKEVKLYRQPSGSFASNNELYKMVTDGDGFIVTDNWLNAWSFNEYGQITEINDKKQMPIILEYDDEQNLAAIVSKSGKRFGIEFDDYGFISRIVKSDGTSKEYAYQQGKLISVTNESGFVSTYNYDSKGRLTSLENPLGLSVFEAVYDDSDRVITLKDGNGATSTFEYSTDAVNYTNVRGFTTTYVSDASNRVTEIRYSDNSYETKAYDARDRLISHTDRAGDTTGYTYDANGNLLTITLKNVLISQQTYDINNNLLSTTDAGGRTTAYVYDSRNNNTQIIEPDGAVTDIVYDGRNRPISVTASGVTVQYDYNGNEPGISKMIDGNGNETAYAYDGMGRLISTVNSFGASRDLYSDRSA